jgi:peptide/nickel transport system permease protein
MAVQGPDIGIQRTAVELPRIGIRWRDLDIWLPAVVLIMVVGACFLFPLVGHLPGPNSGSLAQARDPLFSPGHLLGTDPLGNDELSRALYGGQISIEVGLGSVALGFLVGGALGVFAGYYGGAVDTVVMRVLDVFLAFPSLVLALTVATYLGPNERDVIIAIAFFTTPAYARLARATALRLREQDFVVSAKLVGGKDRHILVRHVVPHVVPSMATFGLLTVAVAMIIESALDYLGLGVRPPQPTWGNMIAAGQEYLSSDPALVLVPAAFLFVTILSLNLLGDALRARWSSS